MATGAAKLGLQLCIAWVGSTLSLRISAAEELHRSPALTGSFGGVLSTASRAEPRTFNPVAALDSASREVLGRMHADLIHINRRTLATEPALAKSWHLSSDGRIYTVHLRKGIRFSDGQQMDADDVVFTFRVYLDPSVNAPQRDLLVIRGEPISVRKIDSQTVRFELAVPYAAAERLFDSIPILPRHKLQKVYENGAIGDAWGIGTDPRQIVGLGPFRLKAYVPGERVVLERNPYYWKTDHNGRRLPFVDQILFQVLPNESAQTIRFTAGELDLISPVSADSYLELKKRESTSDFRLYNAGPGLQCNFLVFNMNDPASDAGEAVKTKRSWFQNVAFRRAVGRAIDREAVVRLAYRGLAEPLWGHVTAGNRLWVDRELPRPARSLAEAKLILKNNSFSSNKKILVDGRGIPVKFTILVSSSNAQRAKIAALLQEDLRELGIQASVVSLEFRSMLDRIFTRRDYDAAVMAVESGDADPNSEMNVWLSGGGTHVWNLSGKPSTPWEAEIDELMREQMVTLDSDKRRSLYNRVQRLVVENAPIIPLASPAVLVGASQRLANFSPAALPSHTLWNADSLYFHRAQ